MSLRNMLPGVWRAERGVWNPMREMNRLQQRMEQMLGELSPEFGRAPVPGEEAEFMPACDVAETRTHYLVTFDLPGVRKSDVSIELQDNQLTVSGERKREHKEDTAGRVSRERYYGAFCRSFTLPAKVMGDKVEAHYDSGVLQISIPKAEPSVGKQIPIKEGKLIESKPGKAA